MNSRSTIPAFAALLTALCTPSVVQAATASNSAPSGPEEERVRMDGIEVRASKVATESSIGTKINSSLLTVPQSVTVITEAEMEARGVQNLNDAVSYSAGVRPESGGMDSRTETMTIRGYSVSGFGGGTNSNIYLDGLRGLSGGQWTSSSFDPFGLERVEVVKGPSAVLYGQVSPGGLINVVSKRPTKDRLQQVAVQYSSHATIQGSFDVGAGLASDTLQVRLVGLARKGDTEIAHSEGLERRYVAPSLSYRLGERTQLTVLTQYQDDRGPSTFQFLPRTGTLVAGSNGFRLAPSTFLGEPDWNSFERTQFSIAYQLEHRLGSQIVLRNSVRYFDAATDYKAVVGRGTDAASNGTLARRIMWGYGDSGNLTGDLYAESRFQTGELRHTLLTGADYYRSKWDHVRWLYNTTAINVYSPVYTGVNQAHLAAMLATAPQLSQDAEERQLGAYVQDQAEWNRLHATFGLRHDSYDIDYLNVGTKARTTVNPSATTWRAGLLHMGERGLSPYLSYTTSFDSAPYTSTDASGKTFSEPAKSAQWEAGLKYQPAGVPALFTASIFELTETNKLSSYKDISANAVYNSQSGEARTRGVELEARFQLRQGLEMIAAGTRLDTEITRSSLTNGLETKGNSLPNVADLSASLWLSQSFSGGLLKGVSIGAGLRYTGRTYDNVNNVTRLPGYTLVDASLSYDLGRRFQSLRGFGLRLSGTNLGDKLYVAAANVAPTAGGAAVAYYGSDRKLSLSLRYAW